MNHMIGMIPVCCILLGIILSKLDLQNKKKYLTSFLVIILLIIQLALFAHVPYMPSEEDTNVNINQKISSYVINSKGHILSENAGFAVLNGKELLIEPFVNTQLARHGLWNQSTFVGDLKNKNFSLIILEFDVMGDKIHKSRFTKEMVNAIRNNYYFVEKIGAYYIYKPRRE